MLTPVELHKFRSMLIEENRLIHREMVRLAPKTSEVADRAYARNYYKYQTNLTTIKKLNAYACLSPGQLRISEDA
jgi:hypothetical protein